MAPLVCDFGMESIYFRRAQGEFPRYRLKVGRVLGNQSPLLQQISVLGKTLFLGKLLYV